MIVSINWLKKFTDIDLSIDELATLIGARLVEIEEVVDLGAKYKDVVVAKVVEAAPVPDSDHLNLCKIDDGGKVDGVERDENGLVQVVCGAPNVRKDLFVAWLPPKTVVPETFNDDEPFVLGARKLRGYMSNGMIASPRELDLYGEHEGILEIDVDAKPGDSFAELYELNDYLLDIENKSLTHRPDCFGLIGLAREISAIQGKAFQTPDWYAALQPVLGAKTAELAAPTVKISDASICARYQAVVLADTDTTVESPVLIKSYLSRSGMRPVSAAVDITNYLMLVTGQPLHAFDYDKLIKVSSTGKPDIEVRSAIDGEKLALLDGRTIEMSGDDIVIAAGETPIALAGAMGGAETEIDSTTKNILLESATFNLYRLRNTQFRHGIFSEAITRFTKGQPAALTAPVLASAARMMMASNSAKLASEIIDCYPAEIENQPITVDEKSVNELLGTNANASEIEKTLTDIGYEIAGDKATAPFWRTDIHIKEDVVEDFGRINGFDSIEPVLPLRNFRAVEPKTYTKLADRIRQILSSIGANEVLTYSFVHGNLLKKVGQNPDNSYRLVNAISPDLQYYRQSLTPSLLEKAYMNLDAGYGTFGLFEINKIQQQKFGLDNENVPVERTNVGMILTSKENKISFYDAKSAVKELMNRLGITVNFVPVDDDSAMTSPYEKLHSAKIVLSADESISLGICGEIRAATKRDMKITDDIAGFELDFDKILQETPENSINYTDLSRYPSAKRDMTFQIASEQAYQNLYQLIETNLSATGLRYAIEPISIYQGDDKAIKNISFRLNLNATDRTLTGDEVAIVIDKISHDVDEKLNAKVI